MTELQTFLFMLNRAKVAHQYERAELKDWDGYPENTFWKVTMGVNGGDDANVIGYGEFVTEFYFDEHGRLLKVGIWE